MADLKKEIKELVYKAKKAEKKDTILSYKMAVFYRKKIKVLRAVKNYIKNHDLMLNSRSAYDFEKYENYTKKYLDYIIGYTGSRKYALDFVKKYQ